MNGVAGFMGDVAGVSNIDIGAKDMLCSFFIGVAGKGRVR